MTQRPRSTWRLTQANYDWLCRVMRDLGLESLNAALNAVLSQKRQEK
jgi:hypothetical protein